jgi:tetratricopeptide (TPR) repeat protein
MIQRLLIILLFLISGTIAAQEFIEEAPATTQEVDLESDLIIAMQDIVLERYEDALQKLRDLIRKTPDTGVPEFHIAKILTQQGEHESAIVQAKRAMAKNPENKDYKELLVELYMKTDDYAAAAAIMAELINDRKYIRKDYHELAGLYQKAKQTDKAIEVLNRINDVAGFDINTEFYKVHLLLNDKNQAGALKVLQKLNNDHPDNVDVLQRMARVYQLMNDDANIENTYNKILKIDPDNPRAISYFSTRRKSGQSDQNHITRLTPYLNNTAIDVDEKILSLAPYVEGITEESPLLPDLINAADILIAMYPGNARTNALYADLMYNSGAVQKSIHYYRESLKYDKSNFLIWRQLMLIYSLMEDWESLSRISTDAIDYYPNQAQTYYHAGRASVNLGRFRDAHMYVDDGIMFALNAEPLFSELKLLKAKIYIQEQKYSDAESVLQEVSSSLKDYHPLYLEIRGDLELYKGNPEKAMQLWQQSYDKGNRSKRLEGKMKTD